MKNSLLYSLALLSFCASAFAGEPSPYIVVAQSGPDASEESSLAVVPEENHAVFLAANSDFLQGTPVRLGLFKASTKDSAALKKKLASFTSRARNSRVENAATYVSPHELTVNVSGIKISPQTPLYKEILAFFKQQTTQKYWTAVHGVTLPASGVRTPSSARKDNRGEVLQYSCEQHNGLCRIGSLGVVHEAH